MKGKKIVSIVRWIFGVMFLIGGLGSFGNSIPYALASILLGASLLPVVWNILEKKNIQLKKRVKAIVPTIAFVLCMVTVPPTDSTEAQGIESVSEAKEAEEAKKAAEAKRKALAASQARSIATAATSAPTGSLNGMALSIPVNGSVSSRFGSRGYSRSSVHTGVDIAASSGTGIRTISAGTVVYSAYKGSYGNLIIIDHGNGVQSYYAHCSALYVSAGQAVGAGTVIGAVGSTGNSTGPHLHLEIRVNGTPVNPQNYLY